MFEQLLIFDCLFFFLSLYFSLLFFFFFNDTATTEIYTLSLHDALPILQMAFGACRAVGGVVAQSSLMTIVPKHFMGRTDRKSTRLNSSHMSISYAVFCLKKKKKKKTIAILVKKRN